MIEETTVVSKVDGQQAWVTLSRTSSCGQCSQHSSCSTQLLGKYLGKREIPVNTDLILERGDKIIVAIDESLLIRSSLLIYMLPLMALFAGALVGEYVANFWLIADPDLVVGMTALGGFSSILWLLNRYQFSLFSQQFARPVVIRKL